MIISANGIVFNGYGEVLLVQRDDTRTLAPPGGACELNELPPDAAAREVREETGLIVFPVRLVGLYFLATQPNEFLFLCFRCIQRGGEISTSDETPVTRFFAPDTIDGPMLAMHREQVQQAYVHSGGPPIWTNHELSTMLRAGNFVLNRFVYPLLKVRRARRGMPDYVPPPDWRVRSAVALWNQDGDALLVHNTEQDIWSLPLSHASAASPPWVLASDIISQTIKADVPLNDLTGIYPHKGEAEMLFVFTAKLAQHPFRPEPSMAWFNLGELPKNLLPEHGRILNEAQNAGERISYRVLETFQPGRGNIG